MLSENVVVTLEDVKKDILEFCLEPRSRFEILEHIQVEITPENHTRYIKQLLDQRFIISDILIIRSANKQKFAITQKGLNYLKAIAWRCKAYSKELGARYYNYIPHTIILERR